MVNINTFTKQPTEKFEISCDFSNNLSDGETISSYTVTATHNTTNVKSTIVQSDRNDDNKVYIKVMAGTNGYNYKLTAIATTNSSNVFEIEVTMKVRDE